MQASHCSDFSCQGAQGLGVRASVVVVHKSEPLECRLNSCGPRFSCSWHGGASRIRVGREVGGGIHDGGDTCIPMTNPY